ncbi:hypothetical protein Tco_0453454 [Tanacetum coccineum]
MILHWNHFKEDLQLEDAEGTDCLPNATIFEQLTHMGYEKLSQKLTFYKAYFSPQWKFLIHTILQCLSAKSTAWNEFSSTMASAIIYLATNQKFNFSKFVQVFLVNQIGDMSTHDEIFVTPSHTKKVFGNMKRVGKGFSGAVTPLFPTMMKKQKPRNPKRKDIEIPQSSGPTKPISNEAVNEENVPTHSNDPLLSGEDRLKLEELMTLCTNLQNRLEKKQRSRTSKLKRLFKVGRSAQVVSSEDEGLGNQEDASKQERKITDIDQDAVVTLVVETQGSEKVVEEVVSTAATITTEEINLAQALAELRSAKPKVMVQEPVINEELAFKYNVKKEEHKTKKQELVREKAEKVKEANISWDNVQEMIKADMLLAERFQAREQEELTDEEKAILFVELLEKENS